MKKTLKLLIALLAIAAAGIYYYVTIPAINIQNRPKHPDPQSPHLSPEQEQYAQMSQFMNRSSPQNHQQQIPSIHMAKP